MEMNMKKNFYKLIFIFTVIISAFQFVACNDIMGYSVLLWNEPEYKLQDGDIVPVYIRSNISSVYVVGVTDEEGEKKIELPLWQLTEPVSKRKVEQSKAKYEANLLFRIFFLFFVVKKLFEFLSKYSQTNITTDYGKDYRTYRCSVYPIL